jgi:hypothetical protein
MRTLRAGHVNHQGYGLALPGPCFLLQHPVHGWPGSLAGKALRYQAVLHKPSMHVGQLFTQFRRGVCSMRRLPFQFCPCACWVLLLVLPHVCASDSNNPIDVLSCGVNNSRASLQHCSYMFAQGVWAAGFMVAVLGAMLAAVLTAVPTAVLTVVPAVCVQLRLLP